MTDHIVPIMRSQSHQHDQPLAEITAPLKQELILGTKRSPISCGLDHSDQTHCWGLILSCASQCHSTRYVYMVHQVCVRLTRFVWTCFIEVHLKSNMSPTYGGLNHSDIYSGSLTNSYYHHVSKRAGSSLGCLWFDSG